MKEAFRDELGLRKPNLAMLAKVNRIIEEYRRQGYRLTLRQLYYQLVSRDIIPNRVQEYAKLSTLLVKGRMGGVVDWDAIEDRIRRPHIPYSVDDIPDAIQDTIDQYRLDRMQGQEVYVEVWCEKDALSSVLKRVTNKYHIRLMVNRGYSSCTAMYDAFYRFYNMWTDENRPGYILYIGDHDPSGLDMIRDIQERLEEFGLEDDYMEVRPIALTAAQIKEYRPPPNPAKITDPRAKWYIKRFGNTSWEVDALTPEVLHALVQDNIESLIDMDLYKERLDQEKIDKKELKGIQKRYVGNG